MTKYRSYLQINVCLKRKLQDLWKYRRFCRKPRYYICMLRHYTKSGVYSFPKAKWILAMVISCVCMYVRMYVFSDKFGFLFPIFKNADFPLEFISLPHSRLYRMKIGVWSLFKRCTRVLWLLTAWHPSKNIKLGTPATKAWIEQLP